MVMEPPSMSSGASLRERARPAASPSSTESSMTLFLSASRITGTSRPLSVSTATPTCA